MSSPVREPFDPVVRPVLLDLLAEYSKLEKEVAAVFAASVAKERAWAKHYMAMLDEQGALLRRDMRWLSWRIPDKASYDVFKRIVLTHKFYL